MADEQAASVTPLTEDDRALMRSVAFWGNTTKRRLSVEQRAELNGLLVLIGRLASAHRADQR